MATEPGSNTGPLLINEFVAANGSGITDEDGDHSDWIEIYNQSSRPVNLGGWALTNNPEQPIKWPFPDITLGSHQYLVLFASGKNRRAAEPGTPLHTNFKLNKAGGYFALYNILNERLINSFSPNYPPQFRDTAYGRYGDKLEFGYLSIPTPGGPNNETGALAGLVSPVQFSVSRGFYNAPLSLALTTATPGATIFYTTNGSEPTQIKGTIYSKPIPVETTTSVRAVALKPGALASGIKTHTYIFLDDVLQQPSTPPHFPASWGAGLAGFQEITTISPNPADYEMDPRIVSDPRYKDIIKPNLKSLPAVSLVMDVQSFAHLHANPKKQGRASEHPVSVEFFAAGHSQPEFQINAGIRPYNAAPPEQPSPKRSFQLFFRSDYGASNLDYPLFPTSPVNIFDTVLLQAGLSDTPAGNGSGRNLPPYIFARWLQESQTAMSGSGTHSKFVHLYINGAYWGLYNLAEYLDAQFMSTYQGGRREDWFVAAPSGPLTDAAEPQSNQLNYLFSALSHISRAGADSLMQPEEICSIVAPYINPAQFSDYIILNWYARDLDWPENRWYAAMRTKNPPGRIAFIRSSETPEKKQDFITNALFETLMQRQDFRVTFADRLYKHLSANGVLADAQAKHRWNKLNETLSRAITGDLARWGDAYPNAPLEQEVWRKSNEAVTVQMEGRAEKLLATATGLGYYPEFNPPRFNRPGGFVEAGYSLTMSSPVGKIYYTTDGSDPRLPVTGEVSPGALLYNRPVSPAENSVVKARVWVNNSWSALQEAMFTVVKQDNKLRITEIMYNPAGGDDYEFIEFKNTGNSPVNLASLSIDEGVYFTFPPNTPPLAPGEFALLAGNAEAFAERYPNVTVNGVFDGSLSNKGEKISVKDAQLQPVIEVEYNDRNGWPVSADGRGDSLNLVNVDGSPHNPKNWRAGVNLHGSPGKDNPASP